MKKDARTKTNNELRPEYNLSQLKGGVRGKYYKQAMAGTKLVLIEPDLAKRFPDTASVNRALRLLLDAAGLAATPSHRADQCPANASNKPRSRIT